MTPIINVQYLRAIAAIMVALHHYSDAYRSYFGLDWPDYQVGAFGVDIFFVISGFIMWTIAASRPTSPGGFLKRRIIRIVPLYWAVTIFITMVNTDDGLQIMWNTDYERLIRSLFFIPQWNETHPGMVAPNLLVGWTLNLEMMFYVLFAAALFLPARFRLWSLCGVLVFLALLNPLTGKTREPVIELYSMSIVVEFALGMLLGWYYLNGFEKWQQHSKASVMGLGLFVLAIFILLMRDHLFDVRLIYWGIPAFLICVGGLLLEPLSAKRPIRLFKFLGDASYSIYLTHLMAMVIGSRMIRHTIGETHPGVGFILEVVIAVIFGSIVYILFEKPVTRVTRKVWNVAEKGTWARFRQKQW